MQAIQTHENIVRLPEMSRIPLFWKVAVQHNGELDQWRAPGLVPPSDFHVTLLYIGGKADDEAAEANGLSSEHFRMTLEALHRFDNSEVEFSLTAIMKHPEMIIARVQLPEDLPCACAPHLTLCRSPGVAPKFAKELMNCPSMCDVQELAPGLTFRGVVSLEVSSSAERPRTGDVVDPTTFEGQLLSVQTNARAGRQTEPSGCASFLTGTEDEIQKWAAALVASNKERPAGPASCKLKLRVQAPGKPGHLYVKWGATAATLEAKEIGTILEERLQELL